MITTDHTTEEKVDRALAGLPFSQKPAGRSMIRVAVIGYGYWGPNIVRNFQNLEGARVVAVCDKNPKVLAKVKQSYPTVEIVSDPVEVLSSPDIDAVAVVTPVWTHYE